MTLIAAIDAGGTTFKCAVANLEGEFVERQRVDTTSPSETISRCVDFFRDVETKTGHKIARLGVAAFGPVDVDPHSASYGTILQTPKPHWSGTPLKMAFEDALKVQATIDTDVNAALLAELKSGAAHMAARAAYVTVGTGIGAGFIQDGLLLGKPLHPEFGHIRVQRHPDDTHPGSCRIHGDCLEGLASAKAFEDRWGDAKQLDREHKGWLIEAYYLAQLCLAINLFIRPQKIILGGGLLLAETLLDLTRTSYSDLVASYLGENEDEIASLIVRPEHGDDAGLVGAMELVCFP